jgi:galactokinase
MSITVSYPGRVCLLGEHCDWGGGSSLTVPLAQGIRIRAEPAAADLAVQSTVERRLLEGRWDIRGCVDPGGGELRFVPAAVVALRSRQITVPPVRLMVTSDLPPGRGLSSSAAFCLSVVDALAQHAGCRLDRTTLAALATHVERDLLGVACGPLDPLACVAAAPVLLRWAADGSVAIEVIEPATTHYLVVGSFGAPRDTPSILRALQEHFYNEQPNTHDPKAVAAVRQALSTFGAEAEGGALALNDGNLAALGMAMNRCQSAYDEMAAHLPPLRAPSLQAAVVGLQKRGALGAKFSGAGGDGSVISLHADRSGAEQAQEWLCRMAGVSAWICRMEARAGDMP